MKSNSKTVILHASSHDLKLTSSGGGVGMAPVIGPKVQEKITAIVPITVHLHSPLIAPRGLTKTG